MAVKIGSARIDERGKISGGTAGDQTGNEVGTQNWYRHSKGWRVFRAKDASQGARIAAAMEHACANSKIGYDQGQRNTLYNQVKDKGFDPALATTATETDCSALVRVCCAYAGITMSDFNTSSEPNTLKKSGAFTELTDSKYTTKADYLKKGDILVTKTKGHTVVVLTSGSKAEAQVEIRGGNCFVRKEPDTAAPALGVARRGESYPHMDTAENGWLQILFWEDCPGWVSGKYAKVV